MINKRPPLVMFGDQKQWPEYLHDKLQNDWVLSESCKENCEAYFLRHWSRDYFRHQLDTSDWTAAKLLYEGTVYNVRIKDNAIPASCKQIALSFRAAKSELYLPAYVLVKGISS